MLKSSCNLLSDNNLQFLSQCTFWASPNSLPNLIRPRNVSFSYPSASKRPDLSLSVSTTTDNGVTEIGSGSIGLADQLRLGSLTEDGLSYKESFIVRSYEVGINKTATVETIANLLQEVGCNHAQSVGFSTDGFATTPTMRKLHLIWVTARMHIEIYRYPAWSDVVEIETWCQAEGKIGTRRDFILKDYANGEVIGRATSKWVMMNMDTRKLERVTPEIAHEYLIYCPKELRENLKSITWYRVLSYLSDTAIKFEMRYRLAFPEENNKSLKKISKLEDPAPYSKLGLTPRRGDLDMNHHVNNVTYIGWLLEGVPQELIDTHQLRSITLDYRRECQHDDIVDSLTGPESTNGAASISQLNGTNGALASVGDEEESVQYLHLLRLSGDGSEINRGRTEWIKKA